MIKLKYYAIQGTFWMLMACLTSYLNVILTGRNVDIARVGVAIALANTFVAFLSPVFSNLSDKSNKSEQFYMTALSNLAVVSLVLSLFVKTNPLSILFIFIPSVVTLTLQPLLSSVGLLYEKTDRVNLSRARGIGALSYSICAFFLGIFSVKNSDMPIIFSLVLYTFFTILLISLPKYDAAIEVAPEDKQGKKLNPHLLFAMTGVIFLFMYYNIQHNFMLQIVESLGGDASHMGYSYSIAAASETVAMFLITFLLTKFSLDTLFIFSAFMFALKGILTLYSPNLLVLLGVQVTQFFGFGIFTPVSVYYFNEKFGYLGRANAQGFLISSIILGGVFDRFLVEC